VRTSLSPTFMSMTALMAPLALPAFPNPNTSSIKFGRNY
jgi:hypothetical protein